ncbi:SpoIIE family protein phosphatase [Streptomyces sp. NPDC060333]|uniref:SpoIIE family protein phosphatase n=1 Tax=Streptomyces sp. NPDC060333 TaxID=3347098 RepID=UPI003654D253
MPASRLRSGRGSARPCAGAGRTFPGDALPLYTDGITEARTRDHGTLFGDERLAEVLAGARGQDAAGTPARLQNEAAQLLARLTLLAGGSG